MIEEINKEVLSYEDFMDEVWDRIPENRVSNKYLDKNEELVYSLMYEYYKIYVRTIHLNISAVFYSSILESTLVAIINSDTCNDKKEYVNDAYNM